MWFRTLNRSVYTEKSKLVKVSLPLINSLISLSELFFPSFNTMYARGNSPDRSSSIPITALSLTLGCFNKSDSNSAGATCKI